MRETMRPKCRPRKDAGHAADTQLLLSLVLDESWVAQIGHKRCERRTQPKLRVELPKQHETAIARRPGRVERQLDPTLGVEVERQLGHTLCHRLVGHLDGARNRSDHRAEL